MIRSSPQFLGIEVIGDDGDFQALYDALYTVIGDEGQFSHMEDTRLHVLAICYDLRHARSGHREFEFIENGVDFDQMRRLGLVTNGHNLYYKMQAFWPETLFVALAIKDFHHLYLRARYKSVIQPADPRMLRDSALALVGLFYARILACIQANVPSASYARIANYLATPQLLTRNYATQYIDLLNFEFYHLDPEKRRKSLLKMTKRLVEKGPEYQHLRQQILAIARDKGCAPSDIEFRDEYPDFVEW